MTEVNVVKDIYQNAKMGVIGIDEVIYKIKSKKLLKEIQKAKKEYINICKICKDYLEDKKEEVSEPKMMAKVGSEIMTQMKLFKDDSDKIIIDMMIKGTQKSLDIVNNKKEEKYGRKVKKIINTMLNTLNDSLNHFKELYKLYYFES